MILTIEELLSPRIRKYCIPLWQDGHYKHAAHESMIQVERALKEKGLVHGKNRNYGHTLIANTLKLGDKVKAIKLRVPLSDELQKEAEEYFHGVFSYYRNYTAHDGSKIDKYICARILVLASELLDMIDSSSLSFSDIGGVEGLLKVELFNSYRDILNLLSTLEGPYYPYGDIEGLIDDIFEKYGMTELHINATIDLGLVNYIETEYTPSQEELNEAWKGGSPPSTLGHFELTELGQRMVNEIKKLIDEEK